MKIYIVEFSDYDGSDSIGYFLEESRAGECAKYFNKVKPSEYGSEFEWHVSEYSLDETDYFTANKVFDEQHRIEIEERLERERQNELAELARLKAKYEQ